MKKELLKHLVCPCTKEELRLVRQTVDKDGEIRSGTLVSVKSGRKYHIVNYIPIMLEGYGSREFRKRMQRFDGWAFEWKSKEFEFNTGADDIGADKDQLEHDFQLRKIGLDGKDVLEAGCGGGRLTSVLYRKGVRNYFMMDISDAVHEARKKHKGLRNAHFIRGDITHPPFRDSSLDVIFNLAVLQHAENPRKALHGMTATLKKGGILAVSHYMWPRNLVVRLKVWSVERIRDMIRILRISPGAVMAFSRLSIPSYKYWPLRPLFWLFFYKPSMKVPSDKVIWQVNYDAFNPMTFQHWNTPRSMKRMLAGAGLRIVTESRIIPNAYVCRKR